MATKTSSITASVTGQITSHLSLHFEMWLNNSSAMSLVFTLMSMQVGVLLGHLSPEFCGVVGAQTRDTLLVPCRLAGMLLVNKMFNRMLPAHINNASSLTATKTWNVTQQHTGHEDQQISLPGCVQNNVPVTGFLMTFQDLFMYISRTFQDHLCPFSMSFQYRLTEWISKKSDCYTHMLINHLLYITNNDDMFQTTIVNKQNCSY